MATPNPLPFQYGARWPMLNADMDEEVVRILEDRDRQLEDYLGKVDRPSWTSPTLLNGWTPQGSEIVKWRRVGDVIELRGTAIAGTTGAPMFVIPHVPSQYTRWATSVWPPAGNPVQAGRGDLTLSGQFVAQWPTAATNIWQLDGVRLPLT